MAVSPDPRTLLLPDPDAIPSFLSDKFAPLLGVVMGFTSVAFQRYTVRRPLLSGIQTHIALAAVGGGIAKYWHVKRGQYLSDRDAVYRHYIDLHPDDFPPPERKRMGEVFKEWYPIR